MIRNYKVIPEEMEYKNYNEIKLLYNDIYNGYHYFIISYGTHPCAYISINENDILYGKGYLDIEDNYNINVHGGFTYAHNELRLSENTTLYNPWYLGWDYAHVGDYFGYRCDLLNELDKKWSTLEIIEECKNVINQIKELNNGRL